jgi:hypothetical protein
MTYINVGENCFVCFKSSQPGSPALSAMPPKAEVSYAAATQQTRWPVGRQLSAFKVGETMGAHANAIQTYIRAKDENRPHLMPGAFAHDASLQMKVETENISFPPASKGIEAITQVLVRDFGRTYENIYTFCLDNSPSDVEADFRCRWLVGMSDKETKSIRVGCGHYDWRFGSSELIQNLTITIKTVLILSSDHHQQVMNWLSHLPYPWCSAEAAATRMPPLSELNEIHQFLTHDSK